MYVPYLNVKHRWKPKTLELCSSLCQEHSHAQRCMCLLFYAVMKTVLPQRCSKKYSQFSVLFYNFGNRKSINFCPEHAKTQYEPVVLRSFILILNKNLNAYRLHSARQIIIAKKCTYCRHYLQTVQFAAG